MAAPYHGPGRPQVHFSALRGWLNDSSGMFYLNGKWHYYYMKQSSVLVAGVMIVLAEIIDIVRNRLNG